MGAKQAWEPKGTKNDSTKAHTSIVPPSHSLLTQEKEQLLLSPHSSFNMSPSHNTTTDSNPKPSPAPTLNIAILLNSYRSPFITEIRDSYIRSIGAVSPDSTLTFFYPAERVDDFPDPNAFDLIVIGGGNADPRKKHQWILCVHHFILDVVASHPRKKLCGICWGHQTISMLFGGEVVDMEMPEVRLSLLSRFLLLATDLRQNSLA